MSDIEKAQLDNSDAVERLEQGIRDGSRQDFWENAKPSLVRRLRGIYAVGPKADQGMAEFGYRLMTVGEPIRYEAAARIEELEANLRTAQENAITILAMKQGVDDLNAELEADAEIARLAREYVAARHDSATKAKGGYNAGYYYTRLNDCHAALIAAVEREQPK